MAKTAPKRIRGTTLILCGVLAAMVIFVAVLVVWKKPPEEAAEVAEKAVAVRVREVTPRRTVDSVVLPGRLEPFEDVVLSVEKSGRIVELNADKGDAVEAGEVLLRVDSRVWEAQARLAKITARETQREFTRWEALLSSGATSASDFDAVRRARDLAAEQLAQAEVHVSQCAVRSPISGVVDARHTDMGEYANEGDPAFRVLAVDRLKLVVDVPEREIAVVAPGDLMGFTASVRPDRVFTGEVGFVSAMGSPGSNAFRVELAVDNADSLLRAGMIARVSLVRRWRDDVIALPLEAVIPKRGEHMVFLAHEGRAVRRVVRVERALGDLVLVSSGVSTGDTVIVEGQRSLRDGTLLEVQSSQHE